MRKFLFLVAAFFLISSCTHVISRPMREEARMDVPFSEMKENIDKYKGELFILGGIIVNTKNTDEGSIIEAVHTNVNSYGNIIDPDVSSGRFMALEKGYLDPLIYKKGRYITVAGVLTGSRTKKIGEFDYNYPLLEIRELYLWKEEKEVPYSPYYYPPYMNRYPYWWYDPWWYGPYYGPRHR